MAVPLAFLEISSKITGLDMIYYYNTIIRTGLRSLSCHRPAVHNNKGYIIERVPILEWINT